MCTLQLLFILALVFTSTITNSLTSRIVRSPDESSSSEAPPASGGGDNETEKCGIRSRVDNIITAGEDDRFAQFAELPWIVAILQTSKPVESTNDVYQLNYICSGSLLSKSVILTAAHCVHDLDPNSLRIRAGVHDMNADVADQLPHQERTVKQIKVHGNYSKKVLFHDIAMLSVSEPFSYQYHIGRVCAPLEGTAFVSLAPESYNPQKCLVAGWGKNSIVNEGDNPIPQKLKKVNVDLVPTDQCENSLRTTRLGPKFKLHSSFICAKESADICQGDGGAPLVCALTSSPPDTKYVQVGVTSWGIGCSTTLPGIYAALKTNIEWLNTEFKTLNGDQATAA